MQAQVCQVNIYHAPHIYYVVVSTHLKNISPIGSFSQVGVNMKNIEHHHLIKDDSKQNFNWATKKTLLLCVILVG